MPDLHESVQKRSQEDSNTSFESGSGVTEGHSRWPQVLCPNWTEVPHTRPHNMASDDALQRGAEKCWGEVLANV